MGGSLGCHRSIPHDPDDLRRGKRKYSAACTFSRILVNQERVNINTATEEELMTLPGVSRAVAQSVVEHRGRIGGFKKVEDLALVSGIGATKLEAIKLEICVSSRTGSSQHSPSSLRKEQDHQPSAGMNINTASPAQLMSIRGITEKIARSIATHRAEHGAFRNVEELLRVKHVTGSLLDRVRLQVSVERSSTASPASSRLRSDELVLPPGGPTHILPVRSNTEPPPALRDGKPVVRLATWSLQGCSCDKANNPGVKEVVCMTLLENDIKLLAVQDLLEREALDKFCVELNQGTLASVRNYKWPRGLWKSVVPEKSTGLSNRDVSYSGFIWDSSSGIELRDVAVLDSPVVNGNNTNTQLCLAHFLIGSYKLSVVNVHRQATAVSVEFNGKIKTDESKCHHVFPCIQETLKVEKELVVLGDFGSPPQSSELDILRKEKLCPLLSSIQFTNISTSSPQGTCCLDNIWLSRSLKKIYSGHCMVVREGLTNPWIPDNWSWGGVASDHCPVVAEFYADVSHKELSRPGTAAVDRGEIMQKHER